MTGSPTFTVELAAKVAAGRPETPCRRSTARSALASEPSTVAETVPLCPGMVTRMELALATTWALVTTSPAAVMMMPVPAPLPVRPKPLLTVVLISTIEGLILAMAVRASLVVCAAGTGALLTATGAAVSEVPFPRVTATIPPPPSRASACADDRRQLPGRLRGCGGRCRNWGDGVGGRCGRACGALPGPAHLGPGTAHPGPWLGLGGRLRGRRGSVATFRLAAVPLPRWRPAGPLLLAVLRLAARLVITGHLRPFIRRGTDALRVHRRPWGPLWEGCGRAGTSGYALIVADTG